MAYSVHNFEQGDILYASQLNEMDAQIALNEENISAGISADMLAEEYSANKTYSIGDYVIYDDDLYVCISDIIAPEGWNPAHWQVANLGDGISDAKNTIDALNDALEYTENTVDNTVSVDVTRTFVPVVSNITLKSGATYQIKASIPSAADKQIYISLRDSENTILYSQNSTIDVGATEKVFDEFTATEDSTNVVIVAYVYASSVTSISPISITAELISVNDPSGYLMLDRVVALNPSDKYRYLLFTVAGATASPSGLIILGSNDGVLFDVYKKMGCYVCKKQHVTDGTTYVNSLRDPSVIKIGKYYYIAYTIIGWHQGSAFGMCRTVDFEHFEELPNVYLSDSLDNPFTRVWAPAWFQDGSNYYISVACESDSVFNMYLLDFNPDSRTVTGAFNTEIHSNDYHWYYSNGKYYALGNDTLFVSDTLKSTSYTRIKRPRSGVEGDIGIRLDSGKYRVYAALINGQYTDVEIGMYVEDDISNTIDIPFAPIELTDEAQAYQTELGYKYTHPSVYDFYDKSIRTANIMRLEHEEHDLSNAIGEITEKTYNLVVGKLENRTINPQGTRVINDGTDLWAAPVEQGKTYTVKTQDNSGLVCGFFTAYPLDPNQGATTYNNDRTIQANNYTITAPIDGYIAFRSNSGYLNAQIVEGSVDKDYLPPVTAIDSVARNAVDTFVNTTVPAAEQAISDAQEAAEQAIEDKGDETISAVEQAVSDAQSAVDSLEAQKNTIAQTIASMAQLGTDTTLSTPGMAADAKATGDEINELDESIKAIKNDERLFEFVQGSAYNSGSVLSLSSSTRRCRYIALNIDSTIKAIKAKNGYRFTVYWCTPSDRVYLVVGSLPSFTNYADVSAYSSDYYLAVVVEKTVTADISPQEAIENVVYETVLDRRITAVEKKTEENTENINNIFDFVPTKTEASLANGTVRSYSNSNAVNTSNYIPCKSGDIAEFVPVRPNISGYHYEYGYMTYDSNGTVIEDQGNSQMFFNVVEITNPNVAAIRFFVVEKNGNIFNPLRIATYGYTPYVLVKKSTSQSNADVLADKYNDYLSQAKFSTTSGAKVLTLMHFSDTHNDLDAMRKAIKIRSEYGAKIDDLVHTGDISNATWSDGKDNWIASGCAPVVLNVLGNHESYVNSVFGAADKTEVYAALFAPYIGNWGVEQPDGVDDSLSPYYCACYYYKDYVNKLIRLIVLDTNYWDDYEKTWLGEVLNDARTNGYSVVLACHSPRYVTGIVEANFCSYAEQNLNKWQANVANIPDGWLDPVDDFIDAGGELVCMLAGHVHLDHIGYLTRHENVLCISADTASRIFAQDSARIANEANETAHNVITINTTDKLIKIVRFGAEVDGHMRGKHVFCYDYFNKRIVSQW